MFFKRHKEMYIPPENFNIKAAKKKTQSKPAPAIRRPYVLPDINTDFTKHLTWPKTDCANEAIAIGKVLKSYGIKYTIEGHTQGPSLTQYTLKLNDFKDYDRVVKLERAFKAALNREGVRIVQDGAYINIEIPLFLTTLRLGDLLLTDDFKDSKKLTVAIGTAADGSFRYGDIEDMKHVLVAGASGSGKSVFVQGMILSLLTKHTPDDIELYMIDPKMVEFSFYRPLVHCTVVTETYEAINILRNLETEMDKRYRALAEAGVRDIDGFNKIPGRKMKRIVLFVDELADLMETSKATVERSIVRIAQKARACGIHLVIATQYPKASVVTGLIKANMPTKVCFAVTSPTASCVMLGKGGAEKLLGKGDMLFQTEKDVNPIRLQAGYVEEKEIKNVVIDLYQNQKEV